MYLKEKFRKFSRWHDHCIDDIDFNNNNISYSVFNNNITIHHMQQGKKLVLKSALKSALGQLSQSLLVVA